MIIYSSEHPHNTDLKPFIVGGKGCLAVRIHFETGQTRRRNLQMQHPAASRSVKTTA